MSPDSIRGEGRTLKSVAGIIWQQSGPLVVNASLWCVICPALAVRTASVSTKVYSFAITLAPQGTASLKCTEFARFGARYRKTKRARLMRWLCVRFNSYRTIYTSMKIYGVTAFAYKTAGNNANFRLRQSFYRTTLEPCPAFINNASTHSSSGVHRCRSARGIKTRN